MGQVAGEEIHCETCGERVAFLVFAEGAVDAASFEDYARLMYAHYARFNVRLLATNIPRVTNARRVPRRPATSWSAFTVAWQEGTLVVLATVEHADDPYLLPVDHESHLSAAAVGHQP